jgi:hypothetical protein
MILNNHSLDEKKYLKYKTKYKGGAANDSKINTYNILDLMLLYHNDVYALSLLLDEYHLACDNKLAIYDLERKTFTSASSLYSKASTNSYGETRCATSVSLYINNIFKYADYTPVEDKKYDSYIENQLTPNDKKNNRDRYIHDMQIFILRNNFIKLNIEPDHICCLYKINGSWYLMSSWIYLYRFNIMKINSIREFLIDFIYDCFIYL